MNSKAEHILDIRIGPQGGSGIWAVSERVGRILTGGDEWKNPIRWEDKNDKNTGMSEENLEGSSGDES